jgi:hypothetical protein
MYGKYHFSSVFIPSSYKSRESLLGARATAMRRAQS